MSVSPQNNTEGPTGWGASFLLVLATFFWSGNYLIGRASRETIPPISLAFWRWSLAALVLAPFVWNGIVAKRTVLRQNLPKLFWLSLTGIAGYNVLLYVGLRHTTVIHASLLLSAAPALIALMEWALFGVRSWMRLLLGIGVASVGASVVITQGFTLAGALSLNGGDVLVMLPVVLWAVFSLLLQHKPDGLSALELIFAISCGGAALLFPLFVWECRFAKPIPLSFGAVAMIGYLSLFSSIFAYVLWHGGLARVNASYAGMYLHLIPVFSTAFAILLLDEHLGLYHLVGACLVGAGICLAPRSLSKEEPKFEEHPAPPQTSLPEPSEDRP